MTAAAYDYSDDVMDFDEVLERFDPVMGMEVHVELATNTKMFSDAPNPANAHRHPAGRECPRRMRYSDTR